MSDALGLSIGVTNLVGTHAGGTPLARSSVLTLFQHGAVKVGDPEPNSIGSGRVMRGFVERVGESSPLVARDGTTPSAAALTAEALDAMARALGGDAPVTVAVPAYWSADQTAALREALFAQPALTPASGVRPVTIPDATAALAALHSKPGFPTDGVVTLCDFGASGTSVTLTDAASNFHQIGPTVRYGEFSGDRIDQLILHNLQTGDGAAEDADRAGTNPMASLSRRFDECRHAKEQLSAATVTVVPAPMPGFGRDVRLSRGEFESMISGPLDEFVAAVEDILQRNGIPRAKLAAAATVGGGACIPLITSRLSERLEVPIFTTPQPAFCAAIGAAELGRRRISPSVATTPGPALDTAPPADGQPTDIAPAGWAIQAASEAAAESAADDESATYRALAWSQDTDADAADPIRYVGDVAGYDGGAPSGYVSGRRRWYTRGGLLVAVTGAAAVALVAIVVAAVFKLGSIKSPAPSKVTSPVESSAVQENSELPSSIAPSPSEAPPPPTTVTTVTTETVAPATTSATTRPTWATTTRSTPAPTTTTAPTTTAPTTTSYPATVYPPTTYPATTYPPTRQPWPLTTSPPWGY